MSRYESFCKEDLGGKHKLTCEDYGRMHNGGGPNGCSQPRTLNYFVKELMRVKCHDELQQDRGEGQQQLSAETTTSPLTTAAVSIETTKSSVTVTADSMDYSSQVVNRFMNKLRQHGYFQ